MKIGVCTDKNAFFSDLHPIVRSFFPGSEVHVYVTGDPEKQLEALHQITPQDVEAARALVRDGRVTAGMTEFSSRIVITVREIRRCFT